MDEKHPLRVRIDAIAAGQLGHVTRAQLLALGLTPRWVQSQRDQGLLIAVHAGVYALGHVPRHAHCRAMAAVLACGERSALSHTAALALWDAAGWPATLEVASPDRRRRPGILIHHTRTLDRRDVRRRHGIPVTSPTRTVLDVQARLSDARLTRTVNDLRVAGHLATTAFADLCARSRRVERLLGDGALTRSALEDMLPDFLRRHDLPMPELNVRLTIDGRRREVDALYRRARLIVEIDSWRFHRDRATFERDRAKDAAALAAGYRTVRITVAGLRDGGDAEAAAIRRSLADPRTEP